MRCLERRKQTLSRSVMRLVMTLALGWSGFAHAQLYWSDLAEDSALRARLAAEPMPSAYRLVSVDVASMSQKLAQFRAKSASE